MPTAATTAAATPTTTTTTTTSGRPKRVHTDCKRTDVDVDVAAEAAEAAEAEHMRSGLICLLLNQVGIIIVIVIIISRAPTQPPLEMKAIVTNGPDRSGVM